MRIVNMEQEPRRKQFEYFRAFANPYVAMTVNCDITPLLEKVRKHHWPFFLTVLYCAVNAANDVPQLRRRIKEHQVVEYDNCYSSHTVALPDGGYCYCVLDCSRPFSDYLPYAIREVEQAKIQNSLNDGEDADRLFFVSCIPWVSFTSISLPSNVPADSNVRLTFGKYFEQQNRMLLPVNLMVHHALADGIHMAKFYEAFEKKMNGI